MSDFKYVLIGAGMTGHAAAQGIRSTDASGSIVLLDPRLEVVADWKEPFRRGVVYYLGGDSRVRGVLAWGVFGKMDAARSLIAEPGPHVPEALRGRIPA